MKKLSLLLILLPALLSGQTITGTYEIGDIPTSQPFYSASCNGPLTTLELELPAGSLWQVTGVDVSYTMTAQNGGWKSHQRSRIYCENTDTGESTAAQGVGNTGGVQPYNRSGLNIANGIYPGNTMLVFQMRAWRADLSNPGCNTTYNRVDNFSWTITVHYEEVPDDGSAGIGTMTPDASAIFELQSVQKGFLPPRMPTALKEAIPNPATGLMVYDTDLGSLQVFNGTEWSEISAVSESPWLSSEGDIYYDEGNVGIGTSNPTALLHTNGTGTGEGNILFEGMFGFSSPGDPPTEGSGTRMMWYPDKAAFRVGRVINPFNRNWDKDSIGDYSVAMGINTKALGHASVALGAATNATGSVSTAFGGSTVASGERSTAMGSLTKASGDYSIAMGWFTTASGERSTAMGDRTTAPSFVETVVGRFNTEYTPNSTNEWNSADRLFVIGNGTNFDARSNAMTVLKNGNTGLGTDTPTALLHTSGTGQGEGNLLFEGEYKTSANQGDPPAEGAGTRMMWYPDKAAFRAGRVIGTDWNKENIGNYSVAFGLDTRASGSNAFASGRNSIASGDNSIVSGLGSNASGYASSAFGWIASAQGYVSTAIGRNATASGGYSVAMGFYTSAPSSFETVIGSFNTDYTPISSNTWNSADRLFVIGNGTNFDARSNAMTVLKNGSVGIGTDSPDMNYKMDIADGDVLIHGITVGRGNSSIATNTVMGSWALLNNTSGHDNTAFGSGTLSDNTSGSSNTAIGRRALQGNTNSNYNTAIGYRAGYFQDADLQNSHNNTFLGANTSHIPTANINNSTAVGANVYLQQSNTVILGDNADVGIGTNQPTVRLDVAGNARIRNITWGSWAGSLHYTSDGTLTKSTSDERMKTNIQPLGNSLRKVLQLQGVSFTWIDDPDLGTRIGMIAQDVEKIIPELVFTDENEGYKGINYAEITAVLVEAIKEQQQIIEWLIEKVKANESEY